jgi:hypothetical protein
MGPPPSLISLPDRGGDRPMLAGAVERASLSSPLCGYGEVDSAQAEVFGLLTIAFAVGIHLGVKPARAGVTGPLILAWSGAGPVLAGAFPLREDAAGVTVDPYGVHTANGAIFFLSIGLGLVVMSRRLVGDPRWRGLAGYVLATGIALLVLFVAIGLLVRPADAALHTWLGLAQRTVLAIWFPCTIALALRLRRVAQTTRRLR